MQHIAKIAIEHQCSKTASILLGHNYLGLSNIDVTSTVSTLEPLQPHLQHQPPTPDSNFRTNLNRCSKGTAFKWFFK